MHEAKSQPVSTPKLRRIEPAEIACPHCAETLPILVDTSAKSQLYVMDCQVCCRAINLTVNFDDEGMLSLDVFA